MMRYRFAPVPKLVMVVLPVTLCRFAVDAPRLVVVAAVTVPSAAKPPKFSVDEISVVPVTAKALVPSVAPPRAKVLAVAAPLIAAVPVTARALDPSVAPPIAKDVALAEPSDGLNDDDIVHAIVSMMSPTAAAVPNTTVVPDVAVYSLVDNLEPL